MEVGDLREILVVTTIQLGKIPKANENNCEQSLQIYFYKPEYFGCWQLQGQVNLRISGNTIESLSVLQVKTS